MKIGMLGAGYILKSHATAVQAIEGASLRAVADISAGRARQAAETYGFEHAFGSIEELARSDCDIVHILLPPFLHIQAAEALIDAGKSVFLEKPMGLGSAECAALCDRAEARGVRLGVNHNFLFLPGYEAIRTAVQSGELGRIDGVSVNWLWGLPQLQHGPFDTWMLAAPANLIFELGAHLGAFAVDLAGPVAVKAAVSALPLDLPTGRQAFRHWSMIGEAGRAAVTLSLSTVPGQADQYLRVRGSGGSAQFDFARDIGWREVTTHDNPILNAHASAASIARQVAQRARSDRRRRIRAALRKGPEAAPFEESIYRSIRAFYEAGTEGVDARHSGRFATEVIRLCEDIAEAAGAGLPSLSGVSVTAPEGATSPTVLVVGGTGFIGRRLVRDLVERGLGVRVLSRSANAAAIDLRGLRVHIVQGSHGDPAKVREALRGIETVYHLAKCDGRRWRDYVEGDIRPTRVLAEAVVEARVRRFVYTGTIDSYSSDDPSHGINSSTPLDRRIASRNLYARSKAACEAMLRELHRSKGLPLVIMRPGIVIGPGTPITHLGVAHFASETHVRFWGDGSNKLPFVLVDDVADALARAHDAPGIEGETFLLTSPPLLTAQDYVREVSRRAGVRIDARSRPAWRDWLPDLAKEAAKNLIRHPNRRRPSLHDWRCRSHRSPYDSSDTRERLGWTPVADRDEMIARGIHAMVDSAIR